METIYKGRKILSEVRQSGTSWVVEAAIWPRLSEDSDVPRIMRTIGVSGNSEYETEKMALEAVQKLIDDGYL